MSEIVKVNIDDRTRPIAQANFNKILVFIPNKDVPIINSASLEDFATIGEANLGYQMIKKILMQKAQYVLAYGVDLSVANAPTLTEALNSIDEDYHFALIGSRDADVIKEFAEWSAVAKKTAGASLGYGATAQAYVDLGKEIELGNFGLFAHKGTSDKDGLFDAGLFGVIAPLEVGKEDWILKTVQGLAIDTWTSTEKNLFDQNNINYYEAQFKTGNSANGKATDGAFLDIFRGKCWLEQRIKEAVFFARKNMTKLGITNEGLLIPKASADTVLGTAKQNGLIAEYSSTAPTVEEIPEVDRASRKISGYKISARLQGSAHLIEFEVTLTV